MPESGATGTEQKLRAVILHTPADEAFRERFGTHLKVLQERVLFWDRSILPVGRDRFEETTRQIDKANILVLLLSPDFLASDDWGALKERVQKAQDRGAYLFPIRLSPCLWEASEFNDIQLLPRVGKEVGKPDNDDCWVGILKEIKTVVDGRQWPSIPPARASSPQPRESRPTRSPDESPVERRPYRATPSPVPEPLDEMPAGVPPRKSGAMSRIAVGLCVAALFGGGLYLYLRPPPPLPPPPIAPHADAGSCPSCTPTATSTATATVAPPPPASGCPEGMTAIPAGSFQMGGLEPNQTPRHAVSLRAFCLDRTEVTAARYRDCVRAGACSPAGTGDGCNAPRSDHASHPINCVEVADAVAFCKWRGARLPTEAEWEYVARSGGKYNYPWGDQPPDPRMTVAQQHRVCWRGGDTCDVTAHPEGKVKDLDVLGMAGNVGEWVADSYVESYDPSRSDNPLIRRPNSPGVIRGGSYAAENTGKLQAAYRGQYAPTGRMPEVGFRCAASF